MLQLALDIKSQAVVRSRRRTAKCVMMFFVQNVAVASIGLPQCNTAINNCTERQADREREREREREEGRLSDSMIQTQLRKKPAAVNCIAFASLRKRKLKQAKSHYFNGFQYKLFL